MIHAHTKSCLGIIAWTVERILRHYPWVIYEYMVLERAHKTVTIFVYFLIVCSELWPLTFFSPSIFGEGLVSGVVSYTGMPSQDFIISSTKTWNLFCGKLGIKTQNSWNIIVFTNLDSYVCLGQTNLSPISTELHSLCATFPRNHHEFQGWTQTLYSLHPMEPSPR